MHRNNNFNGFILLMAMPLFFVNCTTEKSEALPVSNAVAVDESDVTLFKIRWFLDRFTPISDSAIVLINKSRILKYNIYTGKLEAQFKPNSKVLDNLRKHNAKPKKNVELLPIKNAKSLMRLSSSQCFIHLSDTTFCGIITFANPYKAKVKNNFKNLGTKDSLWFTVKEYNAYLTTFNCNLTPVDFKMVGKAKYNASELLKNRNKQAKRKLIHSISSGFYLLNGVLYLNQVVPKHYLTIDTFKIGVFKLRKDTNSIYGNPEFLPITLSKSLISNLTLFYFRNVGDQLFCFDRDGLYSIAAGKNLIKNLPLLKTKYHELKDVFFAISATNYWLYIAKKKEGKLEIEKNILVHIVDGAIKEKLLLTPPEGHVIKLCRITKNKCVAIAYAPEEEKYYFTTYNYNFAE